MGRDFLFNVDYSGNVRGLEETDTASLSLTNYRFLTNAGKYLTDEIRGILKCVYSVEVRFMVTFTRALFVALQS